MHREKSLEKIHTFALKKGSAQIKSVENLNAPETGAIILPQFLKIDPEEMKKSPQKRGHTKSSTHFKLVENPLTPSSEMQGPP